MPTPCHDDYDDDDDDHDYHYNYDTINPIEVKGDIGPFLYCEVVGCQ